MPQRRGPAQVSTQEMASHKKVIKIEEQVSLQQLAAKMSLKSTDVLMRLLSMGMPGVNINSTLDADTATLLASEFGFTVEDVKLDTDAIIKKALPPDIETVKAAGWSEEAIYDAITVCALFNFYNRWIDATGVSDMGAEAYAQSGVRMKAHGYAPPGHIVLDK